MVVAGYYLRMGLTVYYPLHQQGEVDLVVQDPEGLRRVQVKTATWNRSNRFDYLQCRLRLTNKYQHYSPGDLYDTLFILHENTGWEIPAEVLDEKKSSNLCLSGTKPGYKASWDRFKIDEIIK